MATLNETVYVLIAATNTKHTTLTRQHTHTRINQAYNHTGCDMNKYVLDKPSTGHSAADAARAIHLVDKRFTLNGSSGMLKTAVATSRRSKVWVDGMWGQFPYTARMDRTKTLSQNKVRARNLCFVWQ